MASKKKTVIVSDDTEVDDDGVVRGHSDEDSEPALVFAKNADPFVPEPKLATRAALTEEQKGHIKFCLEWLKTISAKSTNIDFRRGVKSANAELSKLL